MRLVRAPPVGACQEVRTESAETARKLDKGQFSFYCSKRNFLQPWCMKNSRVRSLNGSHLLDFPAEPPGYGCTCVSCNNSEINRPQVEVIQPYKIGSGQKKLNAIKNEKIYWFIEQMS
jgi:hypothetical protein